MLCYTPDRFFSTNDLSTERQVKLMSTSVYEIVELGDGEVALRRTDKGEDPMVIKIQFSKPLRNVLEGAYPQVAKAMMQKGIKMIGEIVGENPVSEDGQTNVLH